MRSNYLRPFLKAVTFVLLFVLLFIPVNRIFSRPANTHNYQMLAGFYDEPENSLDAVYIGSSNCFVFWNSAVAWQNYGITVYPYACDDLPFSATTHLITEVRKIQPDSLIIVNLNSLHDSKISEEFTHYLLSGMPFSANKLSLISRLSEAAGWSLSERMEFYLPVIRFHDRWNQLTMSDFAFDSNGLKGASRLDFYLEDQEDISAIYRTSSTPSVPDDTVLAQMEELLTYCDREAVNILFVMVPRSEESVETVSGFLYLKDLIEQRGYPVLDLLTDPSISGVDPRTDFYNAGHTNIHGSVKVTRSISEYLIGHYGFRDKRGQEELQSWEDASLDYAPALNAQVLDIEHPGARHTDTLTEPEALQAVSSEGSVALTWNAVPGADGYCVYRKEGFGSWQRIADVTAPGYLDDRLPEAALTYRVVPYCLDENSEYCYGRFSYSGISVTP